MALNFNQIRIPEASPPGGCHLGDLIGDPTCGYMSQSSLSDGELLREDMNKRLLIARLVPKLPEMTKDHNIYRGKVELEKFAKDLRDNAGVIWNRFDSGCINIALSTMIPITESYSNEYGTSELLSGMSGILSGGMLGEIAFASGSTNIANTQWKDVDSGKKDENGNAIMEKKEVWADDSVMSGVEQIPGVGELVSGGAMKAVQTMRHYKNMAKDSKNGFVQALGNAAEFIGDKVLNKPFSKIDWPLFWKNCSFQQQYECTTRLWCYNTHDEKMYNNQIVAPIAALMMFVTPRSEDGYLYEWPYLTSFDIIGSIHMPLAYISNLTVIKGGDVGDFSLSGRPNIVDLRFTISSLYGVCVNAPIKVEGQNPDRPAVSKQLRGVLSYKHWGNKVSPNLNGPKKAAEPQLPANIPTNAAQMHLAAQKAAEEYEAYRKRIGGSDKEAKTASDFMYTAYGQNGVSESKRALDEALRQKKEKADQDKKNAQSAAQAERGEKTGATEGQQPSQQPEQPQSGQSQQPQQPQQSEEDKKKAEEEAKKKEQEKAKAKAADDAFEARI